MPVTKTRLALIRRKFETALERVGDDLQGTIRPDEFIHLPNTDAENAQLVLAINTIDNRLNQFGSDFAISNVTAATAEIGGVGPAHGGYSLTARCDLASDGDGTKTQIRYEFLLFEGDWHLDTQTINVAGADTSAQFRWSTTAANPKIQNGHAYRVLVSAIDTDGTRSDRHWAEAAVPA